MDQSALLQIFANRFLAEFDPVTKVMFAPAQVSSITKAIKRSNPDIDELLSRPKGRWDFLEAARRYLEALVEHEELLVGFGVSAGTRSRLTSIHRRIGSGRAVDVGQSLMARLGQVATTPGAEALVVHNHPPAGWRHAAHRLGLWKPTASGADREMSFTFERQMLESRLASGRSGRVRWYVVDEGEIAEFRIPSLGRLTQLLRSVDVALRPR